VEVGESENLRDVIVEEEKEERQLFIGTIDYQYCNTVN